MSSDSPRSDPRLEEERLVHALVSRGLTSMEEAQACRAAAGDPTGADALLARLTAAGALTASQARRAKKELAALLGQQIPGYLLQEKLGQGSMGVVYKARQVSMDRQVAVKLLHPKLAADPEFMTRLTREAHVAAKLSHNNIIQAIDVGSAGALRYFVMELVEGKTIRQELDAGKVYEEKDALEIIIQIAQALGHASKRGLVHRDVKPANIVLTADGVAKLADLGMARDAADLTQAKRERGLTIGTPYYIAPEQIRGRGDIDVRADLYSLGATLYHMTTGQPPFPGKDVDRILDCHLKEELTPPDHMNQRLSSGLGEVVEFLMAKDRRQRYASADDLIIDLECLLSGDPPKLARKKIEEGTLRELAEGDADDEEEQGHPSGPPLPWVWIGVLGGLLGLSVLMNLIQLMHR
ncbi:MAG TPA: serine/threonine-protein kinase [Gemmataceae bacterium]|nr:serine/threonine-protein kinase [Gemmataceae bacterium]